MEALEYISDEDSVSNVLGASSSSSSSSSSSNTPFFPSLSSLSIQICPKLKGWWRNEPHHLLLPSFPPSLLDLQIENCPNLTYMPPFPYLKERLKLSGCSWKALEQKMKMKMGVATTSTYFPLSQLQTLELRYINDLESLPKEWLRNLVSLRELEILSCDGLVSLPWISSLTSLQTLRIMRCPNLTSLPQEIRNLTTLTELRIYDLESLPEKRVRNLISLRELYICCCDGLVSLPGIGSVTSLQNLKIFLCPNLMSLPQEIRNLTSLKELSIWGCPLLGQRCERQIGEDWPLIAHVPIVDVDGRNQQEVTISSGMHLVYLSFNPKLKINYWFFIFWTTKTIQLRFLC